MPLSIFCISSCLPTSERLKSKGGDFLSLFSVDRVLGLLIARSLSDGCYQLLTSRLPPSCPGLFPLFLTRTLSGGFPHSSVSKESACNAGDLGSILGLGRSPGEGHFNPLQYSCLENPLDRGAWQAWSIGSHRVRHD